MKRKRKDDLRMSPDRFRREIVRDLRAQAAEMVALAGRMERHYALLYPVAISGRPEVSTAGGGPSDPTGERGVDERRWAAWGRLESVIRKGRVAQKLVGDATDVLQEACKALGPEWTQPPLAKDALVTGATLGESVEAQGRRRVRGEL